MKRRGSGASGPNREIESLDLPADLADPSDRKSASSRTSVPRKPSSRHKIVSESPPATRKRIDLLSEATLPSATKRRTDRRSLLRAHHRFSGRREEARAACTPWLPLRFLSLWRRHFQIRMELLTSLSVSSRPQRCRLLPRWCGRLAPPQRDEIPRDAASAPSEHAMHRIQVCVRTFPQNGGYLTSTRATFKYCAPGAPTAAAAAFPVRSELTCREA